VWAVLAVAAVCYFVAGAVFSLLDESWVQAAFRLAAAAFLASWLVRNHGPRAGRWSQDRPSAGPGGSPGRDDH
jgi:hypothetical protein